MRTTFRFAAAATALGLALGTNPAAADEIQLPQASPAATVSQRIGTTDVTITYHRPGVKGRTIWGELVPYDEIWRLGANEATTIAFSHDVTVAGQPVPAGKYALFAIPGKEKWTFVLNRQAEQWGAYNRKADQDLARFEVTPGTTAKTEWMTFTITPTGADAAEVALAWDTLHAAFPVQVDVAAIVWKDIDARVAAAGPADGDLLLAASRYALREGRRLDDAMAWIDRALAGEKPNFWTYETKGDLLVKAGKAAEAVPFFEKSIADAQGKTPPAYIAGVEKKLADARAAAGGK